MSNRFSNPKTMPAPRGYTQVVVTSSPGRTIYLSGQLGMTTDGAFAGSPGDFRAQATQCFENLKAGLKSAGAGFEHVVKITNFFVDMAHVAGLIAAATGSEAASGEGAGKETVLAVYSQIGWIAIGVGVA